MSVRATAKGSSWAKPATVAPVVDDSYLPLKKLVAYSGLGLRTLRKRLTDPVAPLPHYRLERKILVRKSDFDAWVLRYRVTDAGRGQASLGAIVDDVMSGLGAR